MNEHDDMTTCSEKEKMFSGDHAAGFTSCYHSLGSTNPDDLSNSPASSLREPSVVE